MKTQKQRVPQEVYLKIRGLSEVLNIPKTKAFLFREKIIMGDFSFKAKKKRGTGFVYS